MTGPAEPTAVDPCADGWAALRASRWQEARMAFEGVLDVNETPEGYEA
jgi:hypothetical protein